MQSSKLIRNFAARHIGRRNYTEHHAVTTLNDLPSPQGSWKTHFDSKQRKYNAHLIGGIGALIGTIILGKAVGFLEFHDDIPARPADISSYK